MKRLITFTEALKIVFNHKRYFAFLLIFAVFLLWLFLYIPVRNVPGNDFSFQLSLLRIGDKALLTFLALLTSLSIVMNIYLLKNKATVGTGLTAVSQGGLGGASGVIASIFGTATCSSCVASLFGFLGVGGVFFLLQYRNYIVLGSIFLILISLYFTSKKVLNNCDSCHVKRN